MGGIGRSVTGWLNSVARRCTRVGTTFVEHPIRAFAWSVGILAFAFAIDGRRPTEDAALLAALVATTGAGRRSALLVTAVVLSWLTYHPVQGPMYWFSMTPLVYLWRALPRGRNWPWEAVAVGFVICWVDAPFMRDCLPYGSALVFAFGCSLFGLQVAGLALAIRLFRDFSPLPAAALTAAWATGCEALQAVYGLPWVFMALALPAAGGPLAQWAHASTIFGVSFILYLINCLWVPDFRAGRLRRWAPPLTAAVAAGLAWVGGSFCRPAGDVSPLPFSAVLVQPHRSTRIDDVWCCVPASTLESAQQLTREALTADPAGDLIVWPEGVVGRVDWPDPSDGTEPVGADASGKADDGQFHARLRGGGDPTLQSLSAYGKPCLFGATVQTAGGVNHVSACLIGTDRSLRRHDKLVLVPVREAMPTWLDYPSVRKTALSMFGVTAAFQAGHRYEPLVVQLANGRQAKLGVSVCYEMYFPWLPQYRDVREVAAIVHLVNETSFGGHPALARMETWACQYRAIESRRWQLLCTAAGDTAVIDPNGVVTASLREKPGALRATAAAIRR